jgi:hypothetical protein
MQARALHQVEQVVQHLPIGQERLEQAVQLVMQVQLFPLLHI